MPARLLQEDQLKKVIWQKGFRVKTLANHLGVEVRTLERHFSQQLRTTPKAWIIRERMSCALPLLADGFSNKEIAASLSYSCESNFCRDFKRRYGCAPQQFVTSRHRDTSGVAF
jgi:AraC-like DNA-binding protein